MCGIAGIIGDNSQSKISKVKDMLSVQAHRGPDGHRILKTSSSVLGFSRLTIIDFDKRSMQPMISNNGSHILIFNGEIYNYKELKNNIKNQYNFKTTSDTEVLLAMLELYGLDCLNEINGMFAFCYYDFKNNLYTFVRDRFGQKPLYYTQKDENVYFASEIKSLLVGGIQASPNYSVIADYLFKGNLDCSLETFFKKINQVEPGSYVQFKDSKFTKKCYWYRLKDNIDTSSLQDLTEKKEFINNMLKKVCKEHLSSDTPIGTALSGGLDSSSMLALMDDEKSILSNNCYSVDFEDNLSEKKWIQNSAKHFNKKSIISTYTVKKFLDDFDRMIFSHDGPLGGLFNCAMENLYYEAKKNNIKVLLDGTGLDESFGGYRIHHLIFLNRLKNSNNEDFNLNLSNYCDQWNVNLNVAEEELNNLGKNKNVVQDGSYFDQTLYTSDFIKSKLEKHHHTAPYVLDKVNNHLMHYIVCSKIPKNTRIKDRQSMSYSIELRMPFLDHRVIELGLSLEEGAYFKGGLTKSIIRNVMRNKLPNTVRLSQKRSIQAPQAEWLSTPEISGMVLDIINSNSFKERGIFNFKKIYSSFNDFLKYGAPNTFHIWQWINIEKFFQIFIDSSLKNESSNLKIEFVELK